MNNILEILGLVSGIALLVPGSIFLFLWYRDRRHPDQKKLGLGFLAAGLFLLLARLLGWS
jgi:hypothetical protein